MISQADLSSQSPTFSTDQFGNSASALRISDVTNYWTAPNGSYFSSQFTVTVWIKTRSLRKWGRILEFRTTETASFDAVMLSLSNDAVFRLYLTLYVNNTKNDTTTIDEYSLNTW